MDGRGNRIDFVEVDPARHGPMDRVLVPEVLQTAAPSPETVQ
jgi:hypothetical protein